VSIKRHLGRGGKKGREGGRRRDKWGIEEGRRKKVWLGKISM